MATWSRVEAVDSALKPIVETVVPAAEAASIVFEGVADGAAAVANIVEIVELLLTPDPLSQLLEAGAEELETMFVQLVESDVYVLPMAPTTWGGLLRPYPIEMAISELVSSVSDTRDPNRPVFDSRVAHASVTLLTGADNWADFLTFLQLLGELLDGTEFNRWRKLADVRFRFDRPEQFVFPRRDRNSQGVPWDWQRTNWIDLIPGLGEVLAELLDLLQSLAGAARGAAAGLRELAALLQERADYIRRLANSIAEVAALLANIRQLVPSLRVLATAADGGGVSEYLAQVQSAGGRPSFKLCAGVTIVAFGDNPAQHIAALTRLAGVQFAAAQAAAGQRA